MLRARPHFANPRLRSYEPEAHQYGLPTSFIKALNPARQAVRHPLLEMPDDVRLGPRDWNRKHIAVSVLNSTT